MCISICLLAIAWNFDQFYCGLLTSQCFCVIQHAATVFQCHLDSWLRDNTHLSSSQCDLKVWAKEVDKWGLTYGVLVHSATSCVGMAVLVHSMVMTFGGLKSCWMLWWQKILPYSVLCMLCTWKCITWRSLSQLIDLWTSLTCGVIIILAVQTIIISKSIMYNNIVNKGWYFIMLLQI